MINYGIESIYRQKDTSFLDSLQNDIEEIYDIIKLSVPDILESLRNLDKGYEDYNKYKKEIQISLIKDKLDHMSKILTERFGVNIFINNLVDKDKIVNIIIPPLNSGVIDLAMKDIDKLFHKKFTLSSLWEETLSKNERISYDFIRNLRDAIKSGQFSLDLKNARIVGLNHVKVPISFNFLAAMILRLEPKEVVSIILEQIGLLFTHLEYLYTTTNNNYTLLNTFLNERFNKQTPPLEALKLALAKTDIDVPLDFTTPMAVLEALDIYILKTFRYDKNKKDMTLDYQSLSDEFVTLFGYGGELTSALIKIQDWGKVSLEIKKDRTLAIAINIIKILTFLSSAIITILIFGVFGILIVAAMIGVAMIKLVIKFILNLVFSLLAAIFNLDLGSYSNTEVLIQRLNKLKLDLIKQVRQLGNGDKIEKSIIISQIDFIKRNISFLKNKLGILNKSDNTLMNEDIETLQKKFVEQLTENELHYYSAKFSDLKKYQK